MTKIIGSGGGGGKGGGGGNKSPTEAKDNLDFAQELQSQINRIKNNDYKALKDIAVILSSGLGQRLLGKTGAVDLYNSLGIQELSVD